MRLGEWPGSSASGKHLLDQVPAFVTVTRTVWRLLHILLLYALGTLITIIYKSNIHQVKDVCINKVILYMYNVLNGHVYGLQSLGERSRSTL